MKKLTAAITVFLLGTGTLLAQEPLRIYSRPPIPSEDLLRRLDLKLEWATAVPTDGRRDGIFRVQVYDDVIVVYTRGGTVIALNPSDGSTRWRSRLGIPYRVNFAAGLTPRSVLAYNGLHLYGLDRQTGRIRYHFTPDAAPTTPPDGDEYHIFLSLGAGRLEAFEFPKPAPGEARPGRESVPVPAPAAPEAGATPAPAEPGADGGPVAPGGPKFIWAFPAINPIEQTPLLAGQVVMIADARGGVTGLFKETGNLAYQLQISDGPAVPMSQFQGMGYVATHDSLVYAIDAQTGKINWRYRAGGTVRQRPIALDRDVYVAARIAGLARLRRDSGEEVWRTDAADRFLAANRKIVYALDPCDNLVLLDRAGGLVLTKLNVRDYAVPVGNDATDRLFLAANDGLIVCLHDRYTPSPIHYQRELVVAPEPAKAPKGGAKKPAAKAGEAAQKPEEPAPEK